MYTYSLSTKGLVWKRSVCLMNVIEDDITLRRHIYIFFICLFSVGVGAFVIGLSHISSFFSSTVMMLILFAINVLTQVEVYYNKYDKAKLDQYNSLC